MQRIQNIFHWTMVGTIFGHMLCCGLPTAVSLISFLSGAGLMATLPFGLATLHDTIHAYETHLIVFSGVMVAFGWGLHEISRCIDCHDTGCGHPPCAPKKKRSTKLLVLATLLFVMNLAIHYSVDHSAATKIDLHAEHSH